MIVGDIETLISETETLMREVVDEAEWNAPATDQLRDLPIYDVVRYHLGWVDETFENDRADPGKRIRPTICLLVAGAAGGHPQQATPVAAAIELLHNFTLMHDDIQDRSEYRRGRPTVWSRWGEAQAINAGDATFALSQLALLKLRDRETEPDVITDILTEFNRMTLRIVEGQVLDLGFAERWDISANDYLRMIAGKTAAIVGFAAWAGARVAGLPRSASEQFRKFGELLGLGFQVRDDFLGIWGDVEATGKSAGDDIRGRKKSIPIILLSQELRPEEEQAFRDVYQTEDIDTDQVARVMALLDEHGVGGQVQNLVTDYHDQALELLDAIADDSMYRSALQNLAEGLVDRAK